MIKKCIFVFLFIFNLKAVEIREEIKFTAKSSVYGILGGSLIGVAGLAFDSEFDAIPKSAAIGLYIGMGFAAYQIYRKNVLGLDSTFNYSYVPSHLPKDTIFDINLVTLNF